MSLYGHFDFALHRIHIETCIDGRLFDNFSLVLGDLQMYLLRWASFICSSPHGDMKGCAFVSAHYEEIICANIEHGDRNSTDKSGNIFSSTFIDTELDRHDSNFTFVAMLGYKELVG